MIVARKRKLDLAEYKRRLEEEQEQLRVGLQRIHDRAAGRDRLNSDTASEDFDEPGGDAAQETLERSQSMAIGENLREMLENVNKALKKVDDGTYGTCDMCEKDIPKARLEIMPFATMCTACRARISP
jgi:RNA polymerase-binding transcription factor DksA